jgi:hypothetical protein
MSKIIKQYTVPFDNVRRIVISLLDDDTMEYGDILSPPFPTFPPDIELIGYDSRIPNSHV